MPQTARRALNKAIGGLGETLGSMSEGMLVPSLVNKFRQLGYTFETANRRKKVENDRHEIVTEVDALLENHAQAMAVEVKTTLRPYDVDYHVERMEKIRHNADQLDDKREFFGAMAANVVDDDTRRYALSQGFYLIEPLGDDVVIQAPGKAKAW